MGKNVFWAVRWGEKIDGPNLRISAKTHSPIEACRYCWGMVAANMYVKNLGSRVAPLQSNKWRVANLTDDGEWIRMGIVKFKF